MAAIWKAPVVFIITNNLYGEYSPLRATTPTATTWPAGPTRTACPASSWTARTSTPSTRRPSRPSSERARGGGPSLLEMKTYRYRGHSRSDPAKYRPDGELEAWKARDPIELLGGRARRGRASSARRPGGEIRTETQAEIDAAAERAAAAPYPTLEETRPYVYAD